MADDNCTDLRDMLDAQAADFQRLQDHMFRFYEDVAAQVSILAGAENLSCAPAIRWRLETLGIDRG